MKMELEVAFLEGFPLDRMMDSSTFSHENNYTNQKLGLALQGVVWTGIWCARILV
jgi:hypothetical protein